MENYYVLPPEIERQMAEPAKQDHMKPTWKTRNEIARVPGVGDPIVWIADEIT